VLLADLVAASDDVARLSGRLQKIARLAECLSRLDAAEAMIGVSFLSGTTRQGRLGVGPAAVVAASHVPAAPTPALSLSDVDAAFSAIQRTTGKGSTAERSRLLGDLFARSTPAEQDFLRRLLFGELRQGALEGVLADAVAKASGLPAARIRRASMMAGDLAVVSAAALSGDGSALDAFSIELMRPIQPMLADTAATVDEALSMLDDDAALEYKIDGARIQVHKRGAAVRVFTRLLNDVTDSAPEIVEIVQALPADELILDGEAIALRAGGRPHAFQITMRRFGRTRDVAAGLAELPLTPFFFDCLYRDGTPLIDEPLETRLAALGDVAKAFQVRRVIRPTLEQARVFLAESLGSGHEGVMAKGLRTAYAAGRRGSAWLKVKHVRTLDLVVLAAEWGHGRRKGWLSNLHLGARDPETHSFVMLGKTFKGMTDTMLASQTEQLLALETHSEPGVVYVKPELVVEIAFNDIQLSPIYSGGLALRFARVVRYRPDKTAADVDTIEAVRALAPSID